jgi:glycosyltransferase involved in cell wall biosynthesis
VTVQDRVAVIVPAFNESAALCSVLEALVTTGYEVVVVDDGSTDDTWAVVTHFPVHRLRHPVNIGQGAALQTGMDYARRLQVDMIVHFDADGQHQVEDIESVLAPIRSGAADVTLGSRFLRRTDAELVPAGRRRLLRLAVLVSFIFTGTKLTDAHNGLRGMTRDAAAKITLRQEGFAHASEIVAQIRRHRLRWVEAPTRILYTPYSRAKGQRGLNALNTLFDLVLRTFE